MGFGSDSARLEPEVRRLVGSPDQLVTVDRLVRDDGPGRGAPILVVRNPAGISFEVLIDRALDIGWADAPGLPLAWRGPRGPISSARYEPEGEGWTRTFWGGLLTTCGLAATGQPSVAGGVAYGLHGRIAHIPAENVKWRLIEDAGGLSVEITGDVVETALGSVPLRLNRRIVASTVRPELRVEDEVTNLGYEKAGHMFRHHLNVGYPLIQPGTVVDATAVAVVDRDRGVEGLQPLPWHVGAGTPLDEQITVVYCEPTAQPVTTTRVTAPHGAWCEVDQRTDTWPWLVLWREPAPGVNVLGIEPSTSRDEGRAQAESDGEVLWLEPGQSRTYVTTVRAGMGSSETAPAATV